MWALLARSLQLQAARSWHLLVSCFLGLALLSEYIFSLISWWASRNLVTHLLWMNLYWLALLTPRCAPDSGLCLRSYHHDALDWYCLSVAFVKWYMV